jgi:hypothetical protein
VGRIEHKLLDGDKPPNRPKTNGRNTIIPQESNERNILPQWKRAGFDCDESRPVMVGTGVCLYVPPLLRRGILAQGNYPITV